MAERKPVVLVNGQLRELPAGDTLPGIDGAVDSMSITYNGDGTVATVTEDGVTKALAYNSDGTINTISWPVAGGKTRTETYSYTGGVLTGMTATEA